MIEFQPWPKAHRLFRDIVVTEKIDGTNAAVIVSDDGDVVAAQSRKRLLTLEEDNFGFCRWVMDNAGDLARILGPGHHFGEWWGSGIQRGYGLQNGEKRFSLFNTSRWNGVPDLGEVPGLGVVPVLYEGPFKLGMVDAALEVLHMNGSYAAPGFMKPEGVCIYHTQAQQIFKVTIENDDKPKGDSG